VYECDPQYQRQLPNSGSAGALIAGAAGAVGAVTDGVIGAAEVGAVTVPPIANIRIQSRGRTASILFVMMTLLSADDSQVRVPGQWSVTAGEVATSDMVGFR
jgi:hypothetical protein